MNSLRFASLCFALLSSALFRFAFVVLLVPDVRGCCPRSVSPASSTRLLCGRSTLSRVNRVRFPAPLSASCASFRGATSKFCQAFTKAGSCGGVVK